MKQEDKELLLKDLCARLPYGIKINYQNYPYPLSVSSISGETIHHTSYFVCGNIEVRSHKIEEIKPYLRPMSSMTEEECITLSKLIPYETDAWKYIKTPVPLYIANIEQFDFFHRHHLDWRGLIKKGLAIEVTEENNPYKD